MFFISLAAPEVEASEDDVSIGMPHALVSLTAFTTQIRIPVFEYLYYVMYIYVCKKGKGAFQFIVFSKKPCLINSEQNPTSSINPFYFTSQPLHLTCNR